MRRAGSLGSIITIGLLCVLSALTLVDALTGWKAFPAYLLAGLLALGLAGFILAIKSGRGAPVRAVLLAIVIACLAIHLVVSALVAYDRQTWGRLAPRKAEAALASVVSIFNQYQADLEREAGAIASRAEIRAVLGSPNRLVAFRETGKLGPRLQRKYGIAGLAVGDAAGRGLAWSGDLPDYFEDRRQGPPAEGVGLGQSTVYYWLEAHARVEPAANAGAEAGWVSVFRAIDARYPGVLPGRFTRTLAEEMTRRVGHQVRIDLGAEAGQVGAGGGVGGEELASGVLRLSDGRPAGTVEVEVRSFEDERALQEGRGLFIAGLLLLALVGIAAVALARHLLGRRLSKASPGNVLFFVAVVWAARWVVALLRDPLHLERLRAFTSLDYATQIPTGVLRSPADLALSAVAALVGAVVIVVVAARASKASDRPGRAAGPADLLAGAVAVAGACAVAVLAELGLRRVLADSSINPFALSPADLGAGIAMKVGIFSLTATGILVAAALVAAAVACFGRGLAGAGRKPRWHGALLAGAVLGALAIAVAVAGVGWTILITIGLCLAVGLALPVVVLRRPAPGAAGLAVGLALAAALAQYPHGLEAIYTGQREVVESRGARVVAGTDEWKMSLLEAALSQVAADEGIRDALGESSRRLDSEALRLWAGSILSGARVACGVYVVDRTDKEIGRFSLEDLGEGEFEIALRTARFAGGPAATVSRGTLGGKEADLYVGVAPIWDAAEDGAYLGSIVISIPYSYGDLETMAGLKPTLFEAAVGGAAGGIEFGGGYSASLVSDGRIVETTTRDLEVGGDLGADVGPRWVERKTAGGTWLSYLVPLARPGEALALGFRLLTLSERAVFLMAVLLANIVVALMIVLALGVVRAVRFLVRRARGGPRARLRWSFATKLALAFLLIAIVPTLILGTASSEFVRARSREVMEAKAEESLGLAKLALERQVGGEATRLARNPILMDELRDEPSILSVLVGAEFAASVMDTAGQVVASLGEATLPGDILRSVTLDGRSYNSFSASAEGDLAARSARPIRDIIFPGRITGCTYVARTIDDALARRLASDLATDITFYGGSRVAASNKQDLFVSEMMSRTISADAYADCVLRGREVHFTWGRIGGVDVVIGYSPLRGFDGRPVGAISVPLVFTKDEVGQRMEWTSMALSYLVAVVTAAIFVLGFVLARRISGPIRELIRGTLRVSSGDLGFTIPKPSDDEIGDLVTSFNRMTAALEKSRNTLTERKRYIETIIGNVGAGIISTDHRGRIDTINSAAEQLLRVKAREVRGKEARPLLKRIDAAGLAEVLDAVGPRGPVVRREVAIMRPGGAPQTLRAVASAVTGPGRRAMGEVMVFEDVTELIRSKKLVAWSEMARQVAHEIKNPLTPMKLSAQQILQAHRDRSGDFDGILEEGVATIVEEIEALRRIAVEFSQFSRMPERRLVPTDINEVASESLAQYERAVGGSVEISKDLDAGVPKLVFDRDEMKRVFVNVIENAVQAMPGGGRLVVRSMLRGAVGSGARPGGVPEPAYRVSAGSRPAYAERMRDFVEVSFADTGVGISADNARRLFEPNFSTKSHGTGLGLAISKGTLDAYGGEILVESSEGAGTCVRVRLPVEGPSTQQPRPERRGSRRRRRPQRG
jgi:PAS domain S-box-containing protein